MKKICLCCLALLCLTNLFAQETVNYKEKKPYKTWVKMAPKLNDEFFKTPEAIRIGDNVLLYQQTTGGWPKKHLYACRTDRTRAGRCTCFQR